MYTTVHTHLSTLLLALGVFFTAGVGVGISLTLLVQLGMKRGESQ